MNLEQALLAIGDAHGNDLPVEALETVKNHWTEFYPQLEQLIEQFIEDDTSLTDEQNALLFFGTLFIAEFKYSQALTKCLTLFSRSDSFLTPLEKVFGDALTELTPTIFYNVATFSKQKPDKKFKIVSTLSPTVYNGIDVLLKTANSKLFTPL